MVGLDYTNGGLYGKSPGYGKGVILSSISNIPVVGMPKVQSNEVTELRDNYKAVQVLAMRKQLRKGIKVDY